MKQNIKTIIIVLVVGALGFSLYTFFFKSSAPDGELPEQVVVEKEENPGLQEIGIMDSSKAPLSYIDREHSNYILYKDNEINLYNLDGDLLDSDKTSKGDLGYIAVRDKGLDFTYDNKKDEYEAGEDFFYYLNKDDKDLYKYEIDDNSFADIDKYGVNESNISKLYAFNEIVFYSNYSKTGKMFSNTYDIRRGDEVYTDIFFDQINYEFDSVHTYIYVLNTGKFDTSYGKKELIEIPFKVTDWVANEENIYFTTDKYIGKYSLNNDRIYLYNNFKGVEKLHYSKNKNGGLFGILSKKEINKGYIFKYDDRNLKVTEVYPFIGGEYLDSEISTNHLLISLKIPSSDGGFRTENKILNFRGKELSSMTLKYIPTTLDISNGIMYSLNKFSDKYMIQLMNSSAKSLAKGKFEGIQAVNIYYQDDYSYSKDGDFINERRQLVNRYGEYLSDAGDRVGPNGFILDNYGREINKQTGLPVDSNGNIIDAQGNILKYVDPPKTAEIPKEEDNYMYDERGNRIKIEGESNE